jgi:hypothetical protein
MSYVFDASDDGVWSPGRLTGELYICILNGLASITGSDHGLRAVAADYYDIDVPVFFKFVQSLLRSSLLENDTFLSMSRGFVLASLVMLDRAGMPMPERDVQPAGLLEEKEIFSRSMPTV